LVGPRGILLGVTIPANVAIDDRGTIFLLDTELHVLKQFDPCSCSFEVVPGIGGVGSGVREFRNPTAIEISCGNLYVCDSGNNRISVFALKGFVYRGTLTPNIEWMPQDIAFNREGYAFVTDSRNHCLHQFAPTGTVDREIPVERPSWISSGPHDRLYVASSPRELVVIRQDGMRVDLPSNIHHLREQLETPPFPIDCDGNIDLSDYCIDRHPEHCGQRFGVFDSSGNPIAAVTPRPVRYFSRGTAWIGPLDSRLYQCQWHRVVLNGSFPEGTQVLLSTYTSETPIGSNLLRSAGFDEWTPMATVFGGTDTGKSSAYGDQIADLNGDWEALVRSGTGRYFWLQLELMSDGISTPSIDQIIVEFPRISLRRFLPAVFGADAISGDLTDRFLGIFEATYRSIEYQVDRVARLFDPLSAPAGFDSESATDYLSWLASWVGIQFDRHWPVERRRRFLKKSGELFNIRGTVRGLREQIIVYLGIEPERICCANDQPKDRCNPPPLNCDLVLEEECAWQSPPIILEHFQLRRWLWLGASRLGDQAILWGKRIVNRSQLDAGAQTEATQLLTTQDPHRDPFHFFAHRFSVFVPGRLRFDDDERRGLESLISSEKPAHAAFDLNFVDPRFRIGFQSMIGFDSVVGRYPEGMCLPTSPLGSSTVLGEAPEKKGGPSLEIGLDSRIGSSTKLT
jgi:phage tail-like protein